jgi:hypothetical protein
MDARKERMGVWKERMKGGKEEESIDGWMDGWMDGRK